MLNEKVQELYTRRHALTSEYLRLSNNDQRIDGVRAEEEKVDRELKEILANSLQGEFSITKVYVDKKDATIHITNGTLEIPCRVRYKQFKLSDFARKPGSKQIAARELELQQIPVQKLLNLNKYVVGTSHFEAREDYGYIVFSHPIQVVA